MSTFAKKLRKVIAARKEDLATHIVSGIAEPARYHNLCGQHMAVLRIESDINEILETLKLDEEEED